MKLKLFTLGLLCLVCSSVFAQHAFPPDTKVQPNAGFLRVKGKEIVNNNGAFIFRGLNLGNWLLQEGYMMQTPGVANSQHEFQDRLLPVIGQQKMDAFYKKWRATYITKTDVDSIASWGFNHIRLPMHYNLFMKEDSSTTLTGPGFAFIDSTLKWCKSNKLYLILDMHACPGGQSPDNISDYKKGDKQLWQSKAYQKKLVVLWKAIAKKYANEPWIGGYDLINETVYKFPNDVDFRNYFMELTTAVRQVDKNHIVFIEGNYYANDFKNLTPPWDANMVYSFHKYWNTTDRNSIGWVLEMREKTNIPLYCGEFAENSNEWITEAISLFEAEKIGWSIWPYKKIESRAVFYNVNIPASYQTLINSWSDKAPKQTEVQTDQALADLLESVKTKNAVLKRDYLNAINASPYTNKTKAFGKNTVPNFIPAVNYDLGRNGFAYSDLGYVNYSGRPATSFNSGEKYRNDGVDIIYSDQLKEYIVTEAQGGEGLCYTLTDTTNGSGIMKVTALVSCKEQARLAILEGSPTEGGKLHPEVIFNPSGNEVWQEVSLGTVQFEKGKPKKVSLQIVKGNLQVQGLRFTK